MHFNELFLVISVQASNFSITAKETVFCRFYSNQNLINKNLKKVANCSKGG